MSTETKDWIGDVEVFRHGGGFGAAINGTNASHPAPLGDHNKPLCQFRIAHGLPSKEVAEEAAREWVSRQAEALGLFGDRDARIAELYQELLDRYIQTRCGCGHPACKRCRDDGDTEAVLARARGEEVA